MNEDSKAKKIYGDTLELSAKITQTFDLALLKLTLISTMLPILLYSLFNYFIADMGGKSFVMPYPVW